MCARNEHFKLNLLSTFQENCYEVSIYIRILSIWICWKFKSLKVFKNSNCDSALKILHNLVAFSWTKVASFDPVTSMETEGKYLNLRACFQQSEHSNGKLYFPRKNNRAKYGKGEIYTRFNWKQDGEVYVCTLRSLKMGIIILFIPPKENKYVLDHVH